jgi:hypothetical protein
LLTILFLKKGDNKNDPVQVFSPEEYESMTDTIISVMSAEVITMITLLFLGNKIKK